jgi:stage III sporulation protein SpoIIIAA
LVPEETALPETVPPEIAPEEMEDRDASDLEVLLAVLPDRIQDALSSKGDLSGLLEVVMDLGRIPEARFAGDVAALGEREVSEADLAHVTDRIGEFGEDNRAGIERTLHRISAIRNRSGRVVGLTLRVGRAIFGTIKVIEDLVLTGKSTLLLGRPGVGKTTMLREVARVLADSARKRVVIVDTSNEIAGDGDIPHPSIGAARRMQVGSPTYQHAVMIEAVENHMPEVIVIDEIGTELEANAARTIAERGVQLVATAHGNALENLIRNPTLSDLIGGIHTVTLGDDEARRRRTQKTVLERRSPPTFDVLVEIQDWTTVAVHDDVASVVDRILRGAPPAPEIRTLDAQGNVARTRTTPHPTTHGGVQSPRGRSVLAAPGPGLLTNGLSRDTDGQEIDAETVPDPEPVPPVTQRTTRIMPYGVNKGRLQSVVAASGLAIDVVNDIKAADLLLTTKNYYRRRTAALRSAEQQGKPVYVLRRNTLSQIEQFIKAIARQNGQAQESTAVVTALSEAEQAIEQVKTGDQDEIELTPQGAYVRHLQHAIADQYGLSSTSTGRDPRRKVVIYR